MKQISTFAMSGINGTSFLADNISDVFFNDYDVLILTSSWDDRCATLINSPLKKVALSICLIFDDKDTEGQRIRNDNLLLDFSKQISHKQEVVKGLSTDVDNIWKQILEIILNYRNEANKSLSILYDLSCSPRFYPLSLLSNCFKYGIAGKVDYFYREGVYPEKQDLLSSEEIIFTGGRWKAKHVDSMIGSQNPGRKNRFTVSIGFEGSKTLMILNEFEPDKVNVVIPQPGYTEEYAERVREANHELFRNFGVKHENQIESHAADPVSLWEKIVAQIDENQIWNDTFLCTGTKPHTLGLALATLSLGFPTLIYNLPKEHVPVLVKPTSKFWLYSIKNVIIP